MNRAITFRGVWVLACLAVAACGIDESSPDDSNQETVAMARGRCQEGALCQPADRCRTGRIHCVNRQPVCVAGATRPAGTTCGTNMVCNGSGTCVACVSGAACSPPNPCQTGATSCSTGEQTCVAGANRPNGTACGLNLVCNNGQCVGCTAGLACAPANPCRTGATSCATGSAVCTETGNRPAGTACGVNAVCDGAGVCH